MLNGAGVSIRGGRHQQLAGNAVVFVLKSISTFSTNKRVLMEAIKVLNFFQHIFNVRQACRPFCFFFSRQELYVNR